MKSYSDEELLAAVKNNTSIAGVLREVGLVPAGGNYLSIKTELARLGVDTSHWHLNRGWSKGTNLKSLSEYRQTSSVKKSLIEQRGNTCEECDTSTWCEVPITLELHHIDGDRTNNDSDNLQLLCPNCHSLTKNWRRAKEYNNSYRKVKVKYCECGAEINRRSKTCVPCRVRTTKIDWPSNDKLMQMVYDMGYTGTGKVLGVSDPAIRNRLKNHA